MGKNRFFALFAAVLITVLLLNNCGSKEKDSNLHDQSGKIYITGAGATFPAPLYRKWIEEYKKIRQDVVVIYDAVGSGEGTRRFMAEDVDFGASDSAMKDEQIAQVSRGVQLIPATAGSIVLAYNLPGIKTGLRLKRDVYTDIFSGKIGFWDDPRIKKENPGFDLPHLNIVTVVRSDSSGTTWAFTNHLSTVSSEWRTQGPGTGKKIDFPGDAMFGRGNGGVATKVKYTWGSIGYMEYGYAKRAGLSMAVLENKAGKFITPDDESATFTLANTSKKMNENLRLFIPDPEGDSSYPIVTYTWLLCYRTYDNSEKAQELRKFITWGLTNGQRLGPDFGYAPLPEEVVIPALNAVNNIK